MYSRSRPPTYLALQTDLPTMLLSDPLGDWQPEPCPTWVAAARGIGAVEPLEDVWQVIRRDTHSAITNQKLHGVVSAPQSHCDAATRRRVLERVVHEDQEELLQAIFVAFDLRWLEGIEGEVLSVCQLLCRAEHIEHEGVEFDWLTPQRHMRVGARAPADQPQDESGAQTRVPPRPTPPPARIRSSLDAVAQVPGSLAWLSMAPATHARRPRRIAAARARRPPGSRASR